MPNSHINLVDDLSSLDKELYRHLVFLKRYKGNFEDLALTFSVDSEEFGETKVIELIPNGKRCAVTNENKIRYIYLMANYKLNVQIQKQSDAFLRGLSDLIKAEWLQMFNQHELHVLISGASFPIDLNDLKKNTVYGGIYDENHPTILAFWKVLGSMDGELLGKFVKFVTSCSRPPLLGFSELNPKFCVRDAGRDFERLPTSSTCVNLLKLPIYDNEEQLKKKLIYSINSGSGFDLS